MGTFDPQVNGWAGVDFSAHGLTHARVKEARELLVGLGTDQFLPTVITSPMAVYRETLPILGALCKQDPHLPGIHIEGPFISPKEGAVGAHPKDCVQPPSIKVFKELQELADHQIRLVTLAPEEPGALDLIDHLVAHNVTVSIGHTLAGPGQIQDACQAGATLATHLGNGIPNQLNRTDNPIWSILASPLTVMLITDGFHTPPSFIQTVYAAKGAEHVILTSDAAPIGGCPPGEYRIFGTRVELTKEGCVRNLNAPTLAGSASTLMQCASICRDLLNLNEQDLNKMCGDNIRRLLSLNAKEER